MRSIELGGIVFTTGFGAGGRTRTDTTFYGPRILSPVRLPFRHTGNCLTATTYVVFDRKKLTLCH
jgi:hypothetical protein